MAPFYHDGLCLAVHAEGDGRTMLFQHGLCGDAGQVVEMFPAEVRWQSITLECRGHGKSEAGPLDNISLATFADDLAAFVEARLSGPVMLGGISMGAALALSLAVRRPAIVSGLVLARPAWVCDPAPPNLAPYALVGDLLARHAPGEALAVFDRTETACRLAVEAPDNLASLRGFFSREPVAVTRALLTRIPVDGPAITPNDLGALRVPTLVIGHGQDHAHPLAAAETLTRLVPGARLALITPKASNRDRHRDEFRAALGQFLQEFPS